MIKNISSTIIGLSIYLSMITKTYAHEVYVLTPEQFNDGLKTYTQNPFSPFFAAQNIPISILIFVSLALFYALIYLLLKTKWGYSLNNYMEKLARFGKPILRLSLGISLIFSAFYQSIFGPELSIAKHSLVPFIEIALYLSGFMFLFGFLMSVAAALALFLFLYAFFAFGTYTITYISYVGVILFFMFAKIKFKTEILLRILFGIAIFYTAYTIKTQHQHLFEALYNQYHLQQFFQLDGIFASSIAAVLELGVGLFIIFGFALIPTLFLLLSLLTFFLFYLGENLWPHIIIYGISIYLFLNQFSSNKRIAKK